MPIQWSEQYLLGIEAVEELNSVGPSQELADDTADMVQNWLVDHIAQQDRQYAPYVT